MAHSAQEQLDCALDLMRRMPPAHIEDNLAGLIDLVPQLTEQLLGAIDQPLKIAHDAVSKRDYLLCDYNRDGDSYRSPWSNKYDPPIDGGAQPSGELRKIEVQANEVFDIYRELYYEGGCSSVYCWDLADGGFAACILIKKTQDTSKKGQPMKGTWDAIHVVEVRGQKQAHYKLTSTVMLAIETKNDQTGGVTLAGSLTRQAEQDYPVNDQNPHVSNIGRMVEDMELKLRHTIEQIYFGKTREVMNELRTAVGVTRQKEMRKQQGIMAGAAGGKK